MMKKWFLLFLFVLIPYLIQAKPTIKFKSYLYDFGEVESGKIVEYIFEFENVGDERLVISSVEPSCGCTTTTLLKREFQPGEKGSIPIAFNSSGYNSVKVNKAITVYCNDPSLPEVKLILTGLVKRASPLLPAAEQIVIHPDRFDFGLVKSGKTYSNKFFITNNKNSELRIIEYIAAPEVRLIFKNSIIPPQKSISVEVLLTPLGKDAIKSIIRIHTADERSAYLLLKVEARLD